MSWGHYTCNQRGWTSIFPHLEQMMKHVDLHIIFVFYRIDAINKIFSNDHVEDILAVLVCANSQEF
jgi:hypothetical protein